MSTKALRLTVLLFVFMFAIVVPLHAASNGSIFIDPEFTPSNQTPASCDEVFIEYHYKLNSDHNDNGFDEFAVTIMDANGKVLDTDFLSGDLGTVTENTSSLDTFKPDGITARPITFALYDISDPDTIDSDTIDGHNFATSGTLLAQTVFDPGTLTINGTCENLPFIGNASSCPSLPAGSVVGHTPYPTQVYWAPDKISPGVVLNPGNYWVIGTDESVKFYKIMLSCEFVWVPVQNFQPSFEAPQSGQPLPTTIVK